MRSKRALRLVRLAFPIEAEVVVTLFVLSKLRVVLERCKFNRRTALPASNQTRAEQLATKLLRITDWIVCEKLVELGYQLIQEAVSEEGAVLRPRWTLYRQAILADVSGGAADKHAGRDNDLTWERRRKALNGRRGDTIQETLRDFPSVRVG